jgi:hypothetical protein
MEESQSVLRGAVVRHLVLVLASLLGESAGAVVDPLVAVDLDALRSRTRDGACDGRGRGGGRGDDGVDAGLSSESRESEVVSRELLVTRKKAVVRP